MVHLTEAAARAKSSMRDSTAASILLALDALRATSESRFDIFLSHAVADAVLVLGVKQTLEAAGRTVYVDWMNDPSLNRANVNADTAATLRVRMRQSASLMYLYSRHSQQSRWMPWELGYFDGHNGNVAVLPVLPTTGKLDFQHEEYLLIYPKVDFTSLENPKPTLWINKSRELETAVHWKSFDQWTASDDKLRPSVA